jgi:hypothetical protein
MSLDEIVVDGTLKPDGTLELDQKPSLPPGRVQVVLRPAQEPAPAQEGWWPYMQRARRELEERGAHFMNEEEMNAHIEWLREGDRFDDLLRQSGQESPPGEQP